MRIDADLVDLALYDEIITIFVERLNLTVPALDADLITSGVLHSLALMELLNQLEIHYGLRVALERLDFDDFRSVARIAAFVARERTRNRQSSAAMRT
ncbi:MAG TPA: acyl carrier protein [Burkholderiales bacterium]|nr:acyl carrier protein [Burkholderiales bacterium]